MSLISVRARKEKLYKSLSPNGDEAALISEDERSLYRGMKKLCKSLSPNGGEAALISEDERSLYK